MQGCGNVVFFEARKKQDLYFWLAKTPEGPSVKFLALNGNDRPTCMSLRGFHLSLPKHQFLSHGLTPYLLCSAHNGRAEAEWQPSEGVATAAQLSCGAPAATPLGGLLETCCFQVSKQTVHALHAATPPVIMGLLAPLAPPKASNTGHSGSAGVCAGI